MPPTAPPRCASPRATSTWSAAGLRCTGVTRWGGLRTRPALLPPRRRAGVSGGAPSTPLQALRAIVSEPAWLVGGAVRDRLLGREASDYDVALQGNQRAVARALGRAAGGHPFSL